MKLLLCVVAACVLAGAWEITGKINQCELTGLCDPMTGKVWPIQASPKSHAYVEPKRIGEPRPVCMWDLEGGGVEYNACPETVEITEMQRAIERALGPQ